jgi:hypothetical protein
MSFNINTRGKKMNKKIIIISVFAAIIVLLTGITPAFASNKSNLPTIKNDLVTIEVNHYLGRQPEQIKTTVTASEAEEIRYYCIELFKAQERNDYQAISKYEALLKEKGIFGELPQQISINTKRMNLLEKTNLPDCFTNMAGDNISNHLCYINVIGEGLVMWWLALAFWQAIAKAISNVSNPIAAFILLLALLPLAITVMVLTNLIPFRILAPVGSFALKNGSISCLGLNGFQRVKVGAEAYGVNLTGFTGITLNIPPRNNRSAFLFISGFTLKAEGLYV